MFRILGHVALIIFAAAPTARIIPPPIPVVPAPVVDETIPAREPPPPKPRVAVASRSAEMAPNSPVRPVADREWLLMCIRAYETGGGVMGRANYADDGAPYFGAYQFSGSMWAAYFGDRRPADVPPHEQDAAASAVIDHDGGRIKPTRWPTPYRMCR